MNALLELFQQSIIVQSLITLIVVCVAGGMLIAGKELPDQWWGLVTLVVGYWVGTKGNFQVTRMNQELMTGMKRQNEVLASITTSLAPPAHDEGR